MVEASTDTRWGYRSVGGAVSDERRSDGDRPPTEEQQPTGTVTHGYTARKDAHLKRLRRIEGQIRGLQRMVDEDAYCIDILTQVSAATKALQSFSLELLDEHLSHCVVHAAEHGGEEARIKVREASDAIARLVRS